jgi:hypothetical protein
MKTPLKFSDLEFKPHPMGGFGSHTEINGHTLSVQCGTRNYCSPRKDLSSPDEYESFEIAIWENVEKGPWTTRKFIPNLNDDVAGWISREEIENVITKIENYTHG